MCFLQRRLSTILPVTLMAPIITVVIPVYNRSAELLRALRSVREQTFEDFECVVVDDASTIAIAPIVQSLDDDRFIYLRKTRTGGP